METETVTLTATDGPLPAYEARPDGTARGGVIVVQEAFGVTDHIEDVARRLAAEGYHALAPHFFHRTGDPVLAYDGGFEAIMPHMQALTGEGVFADVDAAIARFEQAGLPASRVGAVGFCMGGSVTTYVAGERAIGASVSFYGGGVAEGRFGLPSQVDVVGRLRTPWLGLFGEADASIPMADVDRLREAVSGADAEIVVYPGAQHGFHCDARPAAYDPDAAKDGWRRTLDWFARHLG